MNFSFFSFATATSTKNTGLVKKINQKVNNKNKKKEIKENISESKTKNIELVNINLVMKYIGSLDFLFFVLNKIKKQKITHLSVLPELIEVLNKQQLNETAIAKYASNEENNVYNYFSKKNFFNPIKINKLIQLRIKTINLFHYTFSALGTHNNDNDFEQYINDIQDFAAFYKINLSIMSYKFSANSYLFQYELTPIEMQLLSDTSYKIQNPIFFKDIISQFLNSIKPEDTFKIFRPDGKLLDKNILNSKYMARVFAYIYSLYY